MELENGCWIEKRGIVCDFHSLASRQRYIKNDKVKLLKGSTLFAVLLCPDGQEILWIIWTDFLFHADSADSAASLFIERAALPCFRHRLGLCLLVSKLPSAPFQSTDPFCRTPLSQQINRKHQSYQYRNIDDGNSQRISTDMRSDGKLWFFTLHSSFFTFDCVWC